MTCNPAKALHPKQIFGGELQEGECVCPRVFVSEYFSLLRTMSDLFSHFRPPTLQTSTTIGLAVLPHSSSCAAGCLVKIAGRRVLRLHAALQRNRGTEDLRLGHVSPLPRWVDLHGNTSMISTARLFYHAEQSSNAPVSQERGENKRA